MNYNLGFFSAGPNLGFHSLESHHKNLYLRGCQ
jgi:hypothetical protein